MMRLTFDAQYATPPRQALIRECGDRPWTVRAAPPHGTGRVRAIAVTEDNQFDI
jgi:nitrogen PTS system EIIA component